MGVRAQGRSNDPAKRTTLAMAAALGFVLGAIWKSWRRGRKHCERQPFPADLVEFDRKLEAGFVQEKSTETGAGASGA
jgi:hypothetical protein